MSPKLCFFRASDRATYPHNVHLTMVVRGRRPILEDVADALIEHFREVDNYGLDKIRGVLIAEDHVHVVVGIPPKRSIAQVATRLKGHVGLRLLKDHPELVAILGSRHLWQRGYGCKPLGPQSMADIRSYLSRHRDSDGLELA
ncbi:MAG: IS200/IS605 family transposase [Cyanobacteria bacterium REEB65]|nr:IS200/IS605 family transposase [Cyanobacteria bacterium REEB65]